jgi:hypothetical protein
MVPLSLKPFIILDLNGVLCHSMPMFKFVQERVDGHWHKTVSELRKGRVGNKMVFVRPGLKEFWTMLAESAFVCVWSSMKLENTRLVCDFLFEGLHKPALILGQNDCITVEGANRKVFMKSGDCELFLKVLKHKFWVRRAVLQNCPYEYEPNSYNTMLIDDSPEKSIFNPPDNAIFPDSYSSFKSPLSDLRTSIFPFVKRLVDSRLSVPDFVRENRIGGKPLDFRSSLYSSVRYYGARWL